MRYLTAGESHGPSLTAIIEGIPAGLKLSAKDINELRHVIEGLANHSHSYQDNVGGGC